MNLSPPKEFASWLDYAIATMDVRGSYLDRMFEDAGMPSQNSIRQAAQEEFDHLKKKAVMPWVGILENWQHQLSQRLGRSAQEVVDGSLLATDFSDAGVHIQFEDGTELNFRRAFYLGATPADGDIHRVVVFTEHCGYHEFWIGPDDHIESVTRYKPTIEHEEWDQLTPVGREFGSPDYVKLAAEDQKQFSVNMGRLIHEAATCRDARSFVASLAVDDEVWSDAKNIRQALHEMGHEVSVETAAAVWRHYSQSIAAGWLTGAQTVASAAIALYLYCPPRSKCS